MRTSRFVLATSALALIVPLATAAGASGAGAATSRVVKVTVGLPPHSQAVTFPCTGDLTANGQQVHVRGPGTPPLGKGSLELRGNGLQFVDFTIDKPASALTSEAISIHGPKASEPVAFSVELVMNSDASGDDLLEETPTTGGAWHRYRLTTDQLEEVHEDSNGSRTDVGPTTYAAYTAAHADSTVNALALEPFGCVDDVTTVVDIDVQADADHDRRVHHPRGKAGRDRRPRRPLRAAQGRQVVEVRRDRRSQLERCRLQRAVPDDHHDVPVAVRRQLRPRPDDLQIHHRPHQEAEEAGQEAALIGGTSVVV